MQQPILDIQELTVRARLNDLKVTIVDQLSFSLLPGETLAIVGESGCGKSVTAHSLIGLLPQPPFLPPEGKVLYHGQNLLKASKRTWQKLRGPKIGMAFQNPMLSLNPVMTIGAQLLEAALEHSHDYQLNEEEAYKKSLALLKEVNIPDPVGRFDAYPHELSGGMRQRVLFALALMGEPELFIADEPTTALDATVQQQVLDIIKNRQKEKGMSTILITHDIGIVENTADKVLVMYASQGVEMGPKEAVLKSPKHPYTQGLLASRPDPKNPKKELIPIQGQVPQADQMPEGCHFHPRCPQAMPSCKADPIPLLYPEGHPNQPTRCLLYETKKRQLETTSS